MATTMDTDETIQKAEGSGPSHADKTRPADAGFVWGSAEAAETAANGIPGGVVMATLNDDGKMEALSAGDIKANVDALKSDAPQVEVVSDPPQIAAESAAEGKTPTEEEAEADAAAAAISADSEPDGKSEKRVRGSRDS